MRNAATDLNASRAKATTQPRRVRTRFRQKYDAGEIPARVAHGTGANAIAWRVDPSALDASAYLPLFIDGLKETKHPYRLLAVRGGIELTRACGERALLDALPRSVLPMKEALGTGDMAVTAVALELLREFVKVSPSIGEALVPYYRNLLPALNALKDVSDVYVSLVNLTDCRSWREPRRRSRVTDDASDFTDDVDHFPSREIVGCGRSKRNIGSLVRATLRALERRGGADALVNIKYQIPTYQSCVRCE